MIRSFIGYWSLPQPSSSTSRPTQITVPAAWRGEPRKSFELWSGNATLLRPTAREPKERWRLGRGGGIDTARHYCGSV